jgi:predicted GIY-YIG superfamily endonuclease
MGKRINSNNNLIYVLTDPDTQKIRYVGQTNNLQKRLTQHYTPSEFKNNTHKVNWLKSLVKFGKKADYHIVESNISNSEIDAAEIFWIAYFKSIGADLVNGSDGGEGSMRGKFGINHPRYGIPHTKEHKEFMSNKMSGEGNPYFGITGPDHPRYGKPGLKGDKSPNAKLTREEVDQIIIDYSVVKSSRVIAKKYGINQKTVLNIVNGRSWTK